MPRPPANPSDIERQILKLEQAAQQANATAQAAAETAKILREELRKHKEADPLLAHFNEPKSFQQLMTATGLSHKALKQHIEKLYVAGKIRRWDLPRFIREDLSENERKALLSQAFEESPLRQNGAEALTGLRRGQVSGVLTELQGDGLTRLGSKKGDPWFFAAKGTQQIEPLTTGDPEHGVQYQQHRPRRGRKTASPPTRKSRTPRDG